MELKELQELISRYNTGTASAEEKAWVEKWYGDINAGEVIFTDEEHRNRIQEQLYSSLKTATTNDDDHIKVIKQPYRWMQWAAAIVLVTGASLWFYFNDSGKKQPEKANVMANVSDKIKPGGKKATLTLADGSSIVLNDAANGTLTSQGNTAIRKTVEGQLVYDASLTAGNHRPSKEVIYNTISTPRGGEYKVILPDGSKVWLNASSSLKFPVAFNGSERPVELTGEAYFEVAKNKEKPFILRVNDMQVQVLGTHFNVMAYSDEAAMETTLLEGSVKVSRGNNAKVLVPGQQAQVSANAIKVAEDVNLAEVTAWKDGLFQFERSNIQAVMRQVARWYDVKVNYEGQIPVKQLTGKISRQVNITQLLNMLAYSGVNFKIEGNEINIMP